MMLNIKLSQCVVLIIQMPKITVKGWMLQHHLMYTFGYFIIEPAIKSMKHSDIGFIKPRNSYILY